MRNSCCMCFITGPSVSLLTSNSNRLRTASTVTRRRNRTGWFIVMDRGDEANKQNIFNRKTFENSKTQPGSSSWSPTPSRPKRAKVTQNITASNSNENKFLPGKLPFALELDYVLNHPISDAIIAALVSLNCLIFAFQTTNVGPSLHEAFSYYEQNLSIVFLIEYFGRWYGKGLSPRYLFTRGMIIDFIAIAPFGFSVADQSEGLFVRILRLSRILRIQRVVMDTDRSTEIMGSMTNTQLRLASIGMSVFSLLYVSAGLFYVAEKDVNPNVLNFFDAFYYSTVTLFTVGFGDLTPLTSWGRLITVLTVLSGAVLVPYQLSEIESVRQQTAKRESQLTESEWIRNRAMGPSVSSPPSSNSLTAEDQLPPPPPDSVFLALNDGSIECKRCFLKGHQRDSRFCRNCGALLSKRRFDQ